MPRPQLAITIDDLPAMWMDDVPRGPLADELVAARQILAAIRRHAVPVAVFVNSGRFRSEDLGWLREWREAGIELGNHTASHLCVDSVPEAEWQADVKSCHQALESAASTPRFFRFPYLRAGSTAARRRAAEAFLAQLGYTIAPVTAATLEWLLAHYYELAHAAGAQPLTEEIAASVVPHVLASVDHAEQLAQKRFRRTIPQIVLLHVNRLTAGRIDDLIETLGRKYQLISLEEALRDPVFTLTGGAAPTKPQANCEPGAAGSHDWFANERRAILQRFQPRLGWPMNVGHQHR
jgi:hypothetical protein